MSDINQDYYVLVCGSGKVPSPYVADHKSHYLTFQHPMSLKTEIRVESSAIAEDNIPLLEAMLAPSDPVVSERIKQLIESHDLYKVQLLPVIYTHADNTKHPYSILVVENKIDAYDFDNGKYHTKKSDGRVRAVNIRLDAGKLSVIPLDKRCIFSIPGMRSTYLIHKSVAEPLIALNASGLQLVPLLQWDIGFGMKI